LSNHKSIEKVFERKDNSLYVQNRLIINLLRVIRKSSRLKIVKKSYQKRLFHKHLDNEMIDFDTIKPKSWDIK